MKRLFLFQLGLAALLCCAASLASQAQTKHESLVARDGFWVVETPPRGDSCVVRFYTNDKKLIYQETINRCLNIARRQTRRQLNTALDQAMFVLAGYAPDTNRPPVGSRAVLYKVSF